MSFLRHGESIDPMRSVPLGASGLAHSQCSSASMSSSRLFLGRLLSSRACFRFAGRERFSKTKPRRTMIFQRTATTPLTPCLAPRVQSSECQREGILTARENQVVNVVAEGAGNREIASQLGITENTVKKSLLRIYDKLGVSNRVELVLYALTHRGAGEKPTCAPPKRPPISVQAPGGLPWPQPRQSP